MTNTPGTTPSDATRAAEESEAGVDHVADRAPTGAESEAAPDRARSETEKDYKEMAERGANVEGEGKLP